MNHRPDDQLFKLSCSGSEEAISVLFLRYYDHLMHYGLKLGADRRLVEESIQDLFLYLHDSENRLGEVYLVKAYLYKAIRRRVIEKVKQEKRVKSIEESWADRVEVFFNVEDLDSLQHEHELNSALVQALNNLPRRQRESIYLRYYNGLSTNEIAGIMGVANQTVLNTLYQALNNIRKYKNLRQLISYSLPWILALTPSL